MRSEKKASWMKTFAFAYEWVLAVSVLYLVILAWMSTAS